MHGRLRLTEYTEDEESKKLWAAWMHRKGGVHDMAFTNGTGPRMHHVAFWVPTPLNIIDLLDLMSTTGYVANIERGPTSQVGLQELVIHGGRDILLHGIAELGITGPAQTASVKFVYALRTWTGGTDAAFEWFSGQPLPSFGGRTAADLVREGRMDALTGYVERICELTLKCNF